ncbi:hypothetical protein [Novosphingobium sp. Chol11]|uniref:hypothetical protein n=1 Tax=Novosphingobium sp. Chol11 TaxID=1385763 RepID=UPI0025DEB202|nr:hypothetical protein [Novosphingobium sp. Chol11]
MKRAQIGRLVIGFLALVLAALMASPAAAANCNVATSQGATGPANWQTYCWLDFSGYNDTAARSSGGQAYSYTLPDGTVMTFTLNVSGAAIAGAVSPTWSGASVGNSSFLGITARPSLYQTAAGTTTATISNIVLTPPSGVSQITSYMFVAADAESSNENESLRFQTNGGSWVLLDQSGPISGSVYPLTSGIGTNTFNVSGVAGTVGAYIVGSSTPTTLTTTIVGGGLQGVMFAVRFATIRLTMQIAGVRVNAADQFKFDINATSGGTTLATGTSSGTGLGPFTAAALSTSSAVPVTLAQAMAAGSVSAISRYQSNLSCTNGVSGSSTPLPSGVTTTSYSFGALQFGDNVACTFTNTAFPHLRLTKALGTSGRRFSTDQFTMNINQGATTVATTTTTGTGTTVNAASTPQVQVSAGTTYTLTELGAGATSLTQYNAAMACTNAATSTTTLPSTVGGTITPRMGDVISCTITNTRRAQNATLTLLKTSTVLSDGSNGATNPKAIPGAIVRYTILVTNTGSAAVDTGTVLLMDSLPAEMMVGTAANPAFAQGSPSSGLTFTASTDIRYSSAATVPTSYAGCTYTPTSAYDPAVKFVCINPKGVMAASTGTPTSFSISFQAQLK